VKHVQQALTFDCGDDSLIGVLSLPPADMSPADTALVVIVGGPQYRVGSHRQFALLARAVAAAGYPALRFDVRGMGDSSGAPRSFDSLDDDIAAAIDAVQSAQPTVRHVVLWALCDGASAALLYLDRRADPRVRALCLLNPWVRSPASLAQTHVKHYYLQRLTQPAFWRKLLGGGVARRAAGELWSNLRLARSAERAKASPASFPQRMALAWAAFEGETLLVLSGDDYTAREFDDHASGSPHWQGLLDRPSVTRLDIAGANHTFANAADRSRVESATLKWLQRVAPLPAQAVSRTTETVS
jgi:exosortase A-associated hydrolase 1